jgi:capsule polysaccharide modification protein KpsS
MTNKILFWIFTDLFYFGLSKFFQNSENELFGIFDVTNSTKEFLKNQKIVKFSNEWYYHDYIKKNINVDLEYLKSFEKKYDVNLWLLVSNERIFFNFNYFYKFSKNEILSILEQECKLFEKILDTTTFDYLIMPAPNFHHDYLFYKMCKIKKIKVLILNYSRFGKKSIITNDLDKITLSKSNNYSQPLRTQQELLDYLKGFDYFKNNLDFASTFMSSKKQLIYAIFHFIFVSNNNNNIYTYYGRTKIKVLLKTAILTLKEKYLKKSLQKYFEKKINNKLNFFYFPLQVEPENSILLNSPFLTNQLEVIKNISKSLPIDYELYVKEHPMMLTRGWRDSSFYKKILDLPNTRLLHPLIDNEKLLENCSGVITISSTAGMEAAFYGKPSIVFADVLYSMLPSVHKISNIDLLPDMISSILNEKINFSDVSEFVNFIDDNSIDFDLFDFLTQLSNYFFYNGFLQDVTISESSMLYFLDQHKHEFEFLVHEHTKKFNSTKKTVKEKQ